MNPTLKNQIKKTFSLVISDFENEKQAFEFLESFLSESEFENLAKRFAVAYWLSKKRNYSNIQNNLKVSSRSIAEIANLGKSNALKRAIKKVDADEWAEKWSSKIKKLI